MAIKDHNEAVHHKEKCIVAAAPNSTAIDSTAEDSPQGGISKPPPEKPIPNYLKPTISSLHGTNCHYPTKNQQQQQLSEAKSTSRKRPPVNISVDKACLPSSRLQAAVTAIISPKRASKTVPLSPGIQKPVIPKEPDAEKATKPVASARVAPAVTKSREAKPDEKQDEALRSTLLRSINREGRRPKATDQDTAEPAGLVAAAAKKPRTRVKSLSMSSIEFPALRKVGLQRGKKVAAGKEGAGARLRRNYSQLKPAAAEEAAHKAGRETANEEEEKGSNAVVEVAAGKRSKVQALLGLFESGAAMSTSHEPLPSQHNEEVVVVKSSGSGGSGGSQQQPDGGRHDQRAQQETEVKQKEEGQSQLEEEEEEVGEGSNGIGPAEAEEEARESDDSMEEEEEEETEYNTTKELTESTEVAEEEEEGDQIL